METIRNAANYVSESVTGAATSTNNTLQGAPKVTADSNNTARDETSQASSGGEYGSPVYGSENTQPNASGYGSSGLTDRQDESLQSSGKADFGSEGRPQTLPRSEIEGRVQERGLGESAPEGYSGGRSEGSSGGYGTSSSRDTADGSALADTGMAAVGLPTAGVARNGGGAEERQSSSGLGGSSTSGLGSSSRGGLDAPSSDGLGGVASSGLETSSSGLGSSTLGGQGTSSHGLDSSSSGGLGSSSVSGLDASEKDLSAQPEPSGGPGIITTADGRQTYAPDGHSSSEGHFGSGSEAAQRTASSVLGQSSNRGTTEGSNEIPAYGSSGTESSANAAPGYPTGGSSATTDYPTLDNPGKTFYSGSTGNDRGSSYDFSANNTSRGGDNVVSSTTDSTAPDRADVNSDDRSAPADYKPDPAATEGSAEVAADNPEMLSKQAEGTTDETAGGKDTGHQGGHAAKRENEDAIPTAGGEKLGQKHWGESKMLPTS